MKKFLAVVIVFAVAFFARKYFSEKTVLRIGVECNYVPNNWEENRPSDSNLPIVNKKGFYAEGYDVQIAKIVADKIGKKIEVKKFAWDELLPALNRREVDAVFSGMLDTEERRKSAAFTDTYEVKKTEYAILLNRISKYSHIKKLEELYGARIVAQKGTEFDKAVEQIPGVVHLQPVETVYDMISMIMKNEVDGAVIDIDSGHTYEKTNEGLKMIRFPEGEGFVLGFNGVCAAVRKRDKNLLEEINGVIGDLSVRDRRRLMDRVITKVWNNL